MEIVGKRSFCTAQVVALSSVWLVLIIGLPAVAAAGAADVSFELDVQPILTAYRCNSGPCHGKARGQNGFQLSLLGFDHGFDYDALTKNARGRRVFPAVPQRSLLLQKATAELPHGGGQRLKSDSADYATLRRWIEQGLPRRLANEPTLQRVEVQPGRCVAKSGEAGTLRVTAIYSDGSQRDVTGRTIFQSSDSPIVAIDATGRFQAGPLAGEATLMARYMDKIATCQVVIPLAGEVPDEFYARLPRHNFVDELVLQKLKELRLTPSPPVDDAKFMRRVYLDVIGRLPAPAEVRAFLADGSPQKRQTLVDNLLRRPEYADYWANQWMDLLRPNPYRVGIKAVLNYDSWIRDAFRRNQPYDQFVRELLTAQGSTWRNGAVTLFRDRRSPEEITTLASQLFLGVRLECAKCHHHPFEKWSQHDFYSFAAYFARIGRKGADLSPPISGGEEMLLVSRRGEVRHPLTDEMLAPRPLFGEVPSGDPDQDLRQSLAAWITSDENPFFRQAIANRVWADLMGRGIVVPVDDLRATNPPSNGPLLETLADYLRDQRYDLQQLIRAICSSYVYGLSSLPGERNVADTTNYSRHYRQRLRAEVLLDAVNDVTGVPSSFAAMPPGSRAMQLWTHRVDSTFLDTFGRPDPNQDPPCERSKESTVTQALHLMNAAELQRKLTADEGRAARLASSDLPPDAIVEELYLAAYARVPDASEREVAHRVFTAAESRRRAVEELLWSLLNSPEFQFED